MGEPLASRESAMPRHDVARLFLAVWPDDAARAQLAAYRDGWHWPAGARPVDDDKLHLTLHFIGVFERSRVAALSEALASVASVPTQLHGDRPEVWRGGIALLRLHADAHLFAMHRALADILSGEGVALDPRPFSPHVTLARRARHGTPPAAPAQLEWPVRGFALVESINAPSARYEILGRFEGAAGPARGERAVMPR
jgi:2'-5' RNA ligase